MRYVNGTGQVRAHRIARKIMFLVVGSCLFSNSYGQSKSDSTLRIGILDLNPRIYTSNDTTWVYSGICKVLKREMFIKAPAALSNADLANKRKVLLEGSGEMSYQRFDRSSESKDILLLNSRSEVSSVRLAVVYKQNYPVSIFFRQSQSRPFQLDNQYEFNISFDNKSYKELIREKVAAMLKTDFLKQDIQYQKRFQEVFNQYETQRQILQSPVYIQNQVQNRIRRVDVPGGQLPTTDIDNPLGGFGFLKGKFPDAEMLKQRALDSLKANLPDVNTDLHAQLLKRKDSLAGLVKKYEDSLAANKVKYQRRLDSINKEMADLLSMDEIRKYAATKGLKDSLRNNFIANLLMKTSLRVGKFILNNSELTVNNIFLHGMDVKYGNNSFVQLSGGYYDFAFRELFNFGRDSARKRSTVFAVRVGKTNGRDLRAFNFYIGRKQKPGSTSNEMRTVAGMSIQRNFYFSKNLQLDLEFAKSTTRYSALNKSETTIKDLFGKLSGQTLGGYGSLKGYLPKTKTDAEISYRYFGTQFESFNASQYFNPQTNLAAKVAQPFFKRKLFVSAGLRYSDFRTVGIASNMKSKALFTSLNAVMRIKKLPIVTVGYYPGSQLYWMGDNKLYEYFYYVLHTTASHYFILGKLPMQTVVSYNKFNNKYSDSLTNNSKSSFNAFWTGWGSRWSYQSSYTFQELEIGTLSLVEAGVTYANSVLRIGTTLKWNFNNEVTRLGYSGTFGLVWRKIGTINFIYDRSFLPNNSGILFPITTGQIQIIKPLKFKLWQNG